MSFTMNQKTPVNSGSLQCPAMESLLKQGYVNELPPTLKNNIRRSFELLRNAEGVYEMCSYSCKNYRLPGGVLKRIGADFWFGWGPPEDNMKMEIKKTAHYSWEITADHMGSTNEVSLEDKLVWIEKDLETVMIKFDQDKSYSMSFRYMEQDGFVEVKEEIED